MGRRAKDYLDILKSWLGYSEANGNYKRIIDLYNSHRPLARGYQVQYDDEWCDVTISAAAIKAGMTDLIGTECGVEEHVKIFQKKGIWVEDGTVTPVPGNIIVYSWRTFGQPNNGYSDHIGAVVSVKEGMLTCIEGNRNHAVAYRTIPAGWGYIRGYAAPRYETEKPKPETPKEESKGEKKPENTAGTSLRTEPAWVGRVTAGELNVRTYAGTEYPNIKSWPVLKSGNLVEVCDSLKDIQGGTWYYIRIDGKYYGFASASYIRRV